MEIRLKHKHEKSANSGKVVNDVTGNQWGQTHFWGLEGGAGRHWWSCSHPL